VIGTHEGKLGPVVEATYHAPCRTNHLEFETRLKDAIPSQHGMPAQKTDAQTLRFNAAALQQARRKIPSNEKVAERQSLVCEAKPLNDFILI
jgi:hypothetical protein